MPAPSLGTEVHRISEFQAHLPPATSLLVGVITGGLGLTILWALTQHLNTIAHEGAHAVMGSSVGGRVGGVRLRPSGEGETSVAGGSRVMVGVAGYLGPSLFGLGAAKLISFGHIVAVLWAALLALAVLLPLLRNAFGFALVIVTGVLIFLAARYAAVGVQVTVAYVIAWFLLLSGVRVVIQHGRAAGDAGNLRKWTRLPTGLWSGLWLAGTSAALVAGVVLLT
jgi:Peptidase M50B-like